MEFHGSSLKSSQLLLILKHFSRLNFKENLAKTHHRLIIAHESYDKELKPKMQGPQIFPSHLYNLRIVGGIVNIFLQFFPACLKIFMWYCIAIFPKANPIKTRTTKQEDTVMSKLKTNK